MKLIFLYGPPAVGKLTVAQELVTLTGYKLFHNLPYEDYGVGG
jgi:tRNA uridine 5-carbamoylmethylation protein Kti12